MKTVWRNVPKDPAPYIRRCSRCGSYAEELKEHWFFTGLYCVLCIRFTLYDDTKYPYYGFGGKDET